MDQSKELDTISLTSTIVEEEDSEPEWYVEAIIAERVLDGVTKYLIHWTGYPISEATWEPTSHIDEQSIQAWEEQKEVIKAGGASKFRVRLWREASVRKLMAKHDRHLMRNALRVEQGLPPTTWERSLDDCIQDMEAFYPNDTSDQGDSSSDEGSLDLKRLDNPSAAATSSSKASQPSSQISNSVMNEPSPLSQQRSITTSRGEAMTKPKVSSPHVPPTARAVPFKANGVSQMLSGLSKKKLSPSTAPRANKKERTIKPKPTSTNPAVNVFSEGSIRKKTPSLSEQAVDASRGSKMLNARKQNLLFKRSRDRENEAPSQLPKNLISLDPSAPLSSKSSPEISEEPPGYPGKPQPVSREGNPESAPTTPAEMRKLSDVPTERHSEQPLQLRGTLHEGRPNIPRRSSLKSSSGGQDADPSRDFDRGRRKSVHWDEQIRTRELSPESGEPGLFVQDEDLASSDGACMGPMSPTDGSSKQPRAVTNIPKKCRLGSEGGRELTLLFHDVPTEGSFPWLLGFKSHNSLVLSHTCTAQDFQSQFSKDPSRCGRYAGGALSAITDQVPFNVMVNRLQSRCQGILCHSSTFCLLIFPSKSAEWTFAEGDNVSPYPMRYVFFPRAAVQEVDLAPVQNCSGGRHDSDVLPNGLEQLYGLNRHAVSLAKPQQVNRRYYFLVFPAQAVQQARLVAFWLRSSAGVNDEGAIFDSLSPGDWSRYLHLTLNGSGGGIIIHEDALWKVRRFPRMFDVLKQAVAGKYTVSVFRSSARETVASRWAPRAWDIGNMGFKRMSLSGKVFLMTPGFVISKPGKARMFLDFFTKNYSGTEPHYKGKLAVPADFVDWLGLVLEQKICRSGSGEGRKRYSEDLSAVATAVQNLSQDGEAKSWLERAPACIHASDEQSLVNWLGWWTIQHLETYGRSYVLGSTAEGDKNLRIDTLRYERYVVNDPDAITAMGEGDGNATRDAVRGLASHTNSGHDVVPPRSAHQMGNADSLELIPNDDPSTLRSYLKDLQKRNLKTAAPITIYFNPILYWQPGMAFKANDIRGVGATIEQWLNWIRPLQSLGSKSQSGQPPVHINTLMAFFYTPENTSVDEDEIEQDGVGMDRAATKSRSRPWIIMLRPKNPHRRPWTQCELLIWDQGYQGKFREGDDVGEGELEEVHRTVIELVATRMRDKDPDMPLSQVWIGGWEEVGRQTKFTAPLDITLERMANFTSNPWNLVPAPTDLLQRTGWSYVVPSNGNHGNIGDGGAPMDLDGPSTSDSDIEGAIVDHDNDDDEEPRKIIFHPPKGDRPAQGGISLCKNILYSKYQATLSKGRLETEPFDYTFPLTKMWYGQQIAEGRDFKHMLVDNWKRVFEELRLPIDDSK